VSDRVTGNVDDIGLTSQPLDVSASLRFCADARAGAIDLFLGCTRVQQREDGVALVALDYEAFAELAEKQLRELVAVARSRFPIVRCVLRHRVGVVPLAEPSVLIAVATPHRAESFAACRWLIDTLKREVAIWKREVWSDGAGSWVDPG
jgi:molybdopterin synthase catalytic subunit